MLMKRAIGIIVIVMLLLVSLQALENRSLRAADMDPVEKVLFEMWLARALMETAPFGVFYGKPRTLRVFMEYEAWDEGKRDWQRKAGKRLACLVPEQFGEGFVAPFAAPYHYEIVVASPPSGGPVKVVARGLISSCTKEDKAPLHESSERIIH